MRTIESRSVENQGKSVNEKGRKDKTKIKEVEENWEIGRNGKGGRKKSSYWTRAMAWLQQLAPDGTMSQYMYIFTRAA